MQFDIFLLSSTYVSESKFASLANNLKSASKRACAVARLEHNGETMFDALEKARAAGATQINLRPVGIPFSQSLRKWVPNAAADWLSQNQDQKLEIFFASDLDEDVSILELIVNREFTAEQIAPKPDGINGKGWDQPPAFEHHLMVCTGPRCHMRGSFGLLTPLKEEIARAGISSKCMVVSTGCLYPCNNGPILIHYPKGDWYRLQSEKEVTQFVREVLVHQKPSVLKLPFAPQKTAAPLEVHQL